MLWAALSRSDRYAAYFRPSDFTSSSDSSSNTPSSHESFIPLSRHFSNKIQPPSNNSSKDAVRLPPHKCTCKKRSKDPIRCASKHATSRPINKQWWTRMKLRWLLKVLRQRRITGLERRSINHYLNQLRAKARKRKANRLQKQKEEEQETKEAKYLASHRKNKPWWKEQEALEACKLVTYPTKFQPRWEQKRIQELKRSLCQENLTECERRLINDDLYGLRMNGRNRTVKYAERKAKRLKEQQQKEEKEQTVRRVVVLKEMEPSHSQKDILQGEKVRESEPFYNSQLVLGKKEIEKVQALQKKLKQNISNIERGSIGAAIFQIRENARKRNMALKEQERKQRSKNRWKNKRRKDKRKRNKI
eukprot:Platyproteum_vivax@DN4053_c0_g1_i1.p1